MALRKAESHYIESLGNVGKQTIFGYVLCRMNIMGRTITGVFWAVIRAPDAIYIVFSGE